MQRAEALAGGLPLPRRGMRARHRRDADRGRTVTEKPAGGAPICRAQIHKMMALEPQNRIFTPKKITTLVDPQNDISYSQNFYNVGAIKSLVMQKTSFQPQNDVFRLPK